MPRLVILSIIISRSPGPIIFVAPTHQRRRARIWRTILMPTRTRTLPSTVSGLSTIRFVDRTQESWTSKISHSHRFCQPDWLPNSCRWLLSEATRYSRGASLKSGPRQKIIIQSSLSFGPSVALHSPAHIHKYALVNAPYIRTKIRRSLVQLFFAEALKGCKNTQCWKFLRGLPGYNSGQPHRSSRLTPALW